MTVDPSDNNSWHNESSPQAPPPPSPPHPRPLAPHPQPTATLAPMCPHACLQTRQGLLYGLSCVVDGTFIEPKVAPNTSSSQPSAPMQPLTFMLLKADHNWHVNTTRLCTVLRCLGPGVRGSLACRVKPRAPAGACGVNAEPEGNPDLMGCITYS